jgi:hypothetical protein
VLDGALPPPVVQLVGQRLSLVALRVLGKLLAVRRDDVEELG